MKSANKKVDRRHFNPGRPIVCVRGKSVGVDGGHTMAFLAHIATRMAQLKLTRTALAKRMDVSSPYVSKVLSGNINLSFGTAVKLARALGMDFEPRLISFKPPRMD